MNTQLRYLVVANQTLGGEQLMDEIRRHAAGRRISFFILVPLTAPARVGVLDQMFSSNRPPDVQAREQAVDQRAVLASQSRLEQLIRRIRAEGHHAEGEIGDENPLKAIDAVVGRGERFDGIIISTLPAGVSRWLGMDLPNKVGRRLKLPVTTVRAKPGS